MNTTITLQSGAKIEITMLSVEAGFKLSQSVLGEMKDVDISGFNLNDIMSSDLTPLKNIVCHFIASDQMLSDLRPALDRALYNGQKISNDTFESLESRSDYIIVLWEVLKYNLMPFLPRSVLGLLNPSK